MMASAAKVPYSQPPNGSVAFGDDSTLWQWLVVTISVCGLLSLCAYVIRVYWFQFNMRRYRWEDVSVLFCFIGLVVWFSVVAEMFKVGGGTHGWNLTVEEAHHVLQWFNTTTIWYGITTCFIKLTILQMYFGLFVTLGNGKPFLKNAIHVCQAAILAFYIGQTIAKLFECLPREKIWDTSVVGYCGINKSVLLNIGGIFNFLTDLLILVVPGVVIKDLMAKGRVRIFIGVTFGALAPIFSIIGSVFREKYSSRDDVSYYFPLLTLYATAELTTGFICLCFPSINGLIRSYVKKNSLGLSSTIIGGLLNQTSRTNSNMGGSGWNRSGRPAQASNYTPGQSLMGTTIVMTGKESSGSARKGRSGHNGGLDSLLNSPVGSVNDISNIGGDTEEITSSADLEQGLFSNRPSSSDLSNTDPSRAGLKDRESSAITRNNAEKSDAITLGPQLLQSDTSINKDSGDSKDFVAFNHRNSSDTVCKVV